MQSFERGGWSGTGPGEGMMKRILPDAHTDFVFAVVGEEFGILLCLLLVALFTVLVVRGCVQAFRRNSAFERMAIAGLATQVGLQAFINMGVNLHILPTKGMTLPFMSYGGSALISTAVTMGFLLALSRRSADQQVTVVPRRAGLVEA
jgi:cell division protein FtsW